MFRHLTRLNGHQKQSGVGEKNSAGPVACLELHIFSATIQERPYAINRSQMRVLLPVPDTHWFANRQMRSTAMPSNPYDA